MQRTVRNNTPIDAARLEAMALAYVARYATTRARLEAYLLRKIRERGWDGEGTPPVGTLAERFVAAGYVDDSAWARARARSLLARGYGARRVNEALGAGGVAQGVREEVRPGERARRHAALALARKRRFGPFAASAPDRALREKQIAAMLRAGHGLETARKMIQAESIAAAEEWAAQCEGED